MATILNALNALNAKIMSQKLQTSRQSGPHYQLSRLVGNWKGTAKTWFEPPKVEDESPIKGTMRLILGGRFILFEYEGSFKGKPLTGLAIYGYHIELRKFQVAWVDSFHNNTAIMFSQGEKDKDGISVVGSYAYVTPEMEQHWGWRTTIEIVNDNEIVITAYNITPEGEEALATKTRLIRQLEN